MSAPKSRGFCRYGDNMVLSTTTTPRGHIWCVRREIDGMSTILMSGLVGVSRRTSAVCSLRNGLTESTFVVST
jgi:hypothetical protein